MRRGLEVPHTQAMRSLIALSLAAAVSACQPATPGDVEYLADLDVPLPTLEPHRDPLLLSWDAHNLCLRGLEDALIWWYDQGVHFRNDPSGTPIVALVDLPGDVMGQTTIAYYGAVLIELETCHPLLIAHELGHALGLGHADTGLMALAPDSWELSDADRAHVLLGGTFKMTDAMKQERAHR